MGDRREGVRKKGPAAPAIGTRMLPQERRRKASQRRNSVRRKGKSKRKRGKKGGGGCALCGEAASGIRRGRIRKQFGEKKINFLHGKNRKITFSGTAEKNCPKRKVSP